VKKVHEGEIANEEKRSADALKAIGGTEDHQRRVAKEVREVNSNLLSEFKKETKNIQKEETTILKYEEKKIERSC